MKTASIPAIVRNHSYTSNLCTQAAACRQLQASDGPLMVVYLPVNGDELSQQLVLHEASIQAVRRCLQQLCVSPLLHDSAFIQHCKSAASNAHEQESYLHQLALTTTTLRGSAASTRRGVNAMSARRHLEPTYPKCSLLGKWMQVGAR